ncbi:MAG: hypothetical protein A3J76_03680 [Candidatus Moranbacteria bacterium RBG_13_45_13]|nr:MAG: hypothetical protein A3J76_03680 [Candidatus Moranbacteria bacterium RBG_13_45_13]
MQQDTILQKTIVEELGLQNLPEEEQAEFLLKMTEAVLKRIYVDTVEALSEGDREELVKLIDTETEAEKIEEFLKGKIENYDEFVKKIVENFKSQMKGVAQKDSAA